MFINQGLQLSLIFALDTIVLVLFNAGITSETVHHRNSETTKFHNKDLYDDMPDAKTYSQCLKNYAKARPRLCHSKTSWPSSQRTLEPLEGSDQSASKKCTRHFSSSQPQGLIHCDVVCGRHQQYTLSNDGGIWPIYLSPKSPKSAFFFK